MIKQKMIQTEKKTIMNLIRKFNHNWVLDSTNKEYDEAITELSKKGFINKGIDKTAKEFTKKELREYGGARSYPNFARRKLHKLGITEKILKEKCPEYFS